MLDPAIHDVHIQHAVGFDSRTLLPSRVVTITYSVGTQGPFTDTTPDSDFSEKYLEEVTGRRVAILRSAGLLPAL